MVSPDVIRGSRLKVERAYRHIDELRSLTEPLSGELHTVIVNYVGFNAILADPQPTKSLIVYRPLKPIPETLAIIIGDAFHNLRGALDHLATGIIGRQREIHYPMVQNREDLITPGLSKSGPQKALAAIEKALPGSKDLVLDKVRPANGPDEALWSFHVLNNDDKHNLIIPTVTVARIRIPYAAAGGHQFFDAQITADAADPQVLAMFGGKVTIEGDFETTVQVKFGQGRPFENDPVIPTLTQIAGVVSHAIDEFEGWIRRTP
jgi:hypothetical protein